MLKRKVWKLATIEIIKSVENIENSVKLEKIDFGDCQFIARKGTFLYNQPVVVVRAGGILPSRLAKKVGILRCLKNLEVKMLVLRGAISDCIILPIEVLGEPYVKGVLREPYSFSGTEVSRMLGILASTNFIKKHGKKQTIFKKLMDHIKNWLFPDIDVTINNVSL